MNKTITERSEKIERVKAEKVCKKKIQNKKERYTL